MRLLALDLGRTTGWAWADAGLQPPPLGPRPQPTSGIWNIPDVASWGEAEYRFRGWLWGMLKTNRITGVIVARPFIGHRPNINVIETLFSLVGQVHLCAYEAGIHWVRAVQEGKARAYFCDDGGNGKDPVMAKCRELGWTFATDDEADALCVVDYGAALWRKDVHERAERIRAIGAG
jgi:hypothetical protein